MKYLCLIELKFDWIENKDIQKLSNWMRFIDTCPYAAVCTALEIPQKQDWIKELEKNAIAAGRRPIFGRVARPLWNKQNWQTYAEIMTNPSSQQSTSILISS